MNPVTLDRLGRDIHRIFEMRRWNDLPEEEKQTDAKTFAAVWALRPRQELNNNNEEI